jgi:tRNA G18 (ribose-2'-O)-methylase SpoU
MAIVRIEGSADSQVAAYRDLTDADLIRARGLFVAEGRLVVRRVIDDPRLVIRSLLLNEATHRALADILPDMSADVPIYVCAADDLMGITGYDVHRGCLALVERPAPIAVCEILRRAQTVVILEAVTNADNVGGVFRNAAAFGADGVLLSPTCCDPLYRKAIRTSMGATLSVPFARIDDWPSGLGDVRATGLTLVALTPRLPSKTIDEFARSVPSPRVALLVGTEGAGLSEEAELIADVRVRIPISDAVDSLNLAVATGIALARLRQEGRL